MRHSLKSLITASVAGAAFASTTSVSAETLIISTALGQPHMWVRHHMDPFADAMEEATGGEINFMRFYAGELTGVGRELDGLNSGTIHVAAPLLAPYAEGRFPLSDITQLPAYGTDSPMVTRAFQAMLDSDVELVDGRTFWDYEIEPNDIRVWALGATAAYSISTSGKLLETPADFRGTRLRAGSAIHTLVVEKLGAMQVTFPGPQIYEALSRGTVDGIVIAISDWPSYSIEPLLKHTITDVSIGHWQSYLAISNEAWERLSPEQRELFDATARDMALRNAQLWEDGITPVMEEVVNQHGGQFVSVTDLSAEMQAHISGAAAETWVTWVEQAEAAGHPGRAAARLYAELIIAEGATLPEGIGEFLGL